ncbi:MULTISPECIES: DNA recombination protein RmuC [Rhodomicrobium]|uniref:DNA recombination protein RmuC n=1 Tax=Rhodomicrobium TaxID=1068 RepID=UPI001482D13C|nr:MULTISPECIES: DNA recombination protein RmuC [Rhodomicrobium]
MAETMIWQLRGVGVDPLMVFAAIAGMALIGLVTLIVVVWRNGAARSREAAQRQSEARLFEMEVAELKGRLHSMVELAGQGQAELSRAIHERLDRVSQNLGVNLEETSRKTSENLARLNERLAVIDTAQRNITELSTRVVSLQDILGNKQQRGAFGQLRMETIIEDGLPRESYSFQATLSNGKRPDCVIHLPGASGGIVIDAKFPLEAFEALRTARDEAAGKEAMRRIRSDVGGHVDDIAAKYTLPGETQDTMLMFVPSEATYADLHENFPDLIQKAHRARVVIVSPNMLMLAVQTMQAIMKDVRTREQAGVIQREVGVLLTDVNRLKERVLEFQKHFGLLSGDVEKIVTSTEKIASRGRRIEGLELEEKTAKVVAVSGNGSVAR